jgi:hypothetical protein
MSVVHTTAACNNSISLSLSLLSLYSNCQNSQKTQEAQISCEKHYGGKEGRAHNNKSIILGRRGCLTYSTLSGYLIMSR